MKVIAFINNKGGVGKTASVTTIGHMMATVHGKKVLLVDLDPQGNTSGRYSQTNFIDIFQLSWSADLLKQNYQSKMFC